jgi:prepilin-type N-terminal cleavage/methylation domain-containing protein
MRNEKGFTLIELVVVIVILGILAAIAIPKFVDLSAQALSASKKGMNGAVKSAFALTVAQKAATGLTPIYPTVTELAAALDANSGTAAVGGIVVDINGAPYTVPTYTDSACTPAQVTTALTDVVLCVGSIP